jgi:hypothetical protein
MVVPYFPVPRDRQAQKQPTIGSIMTLAAKNSTDFSGFAGGAALLVGSARPGTSSYQV